MGTDWRIRFKIKKHADDVWTVIEEYSATQVAGPYDTPQKAQDEADRKNRDLTQKRLKK